MQTERRSGKLRLLLVAAITLVVLAVLAILFYNPARSLASLRKVDDYPLYVMHRYGSYGLDEYLASGQRSAADPPHRDPAGTWACSVFAALKGDGDLLLGRNFDWFNRPTLLLFTHPPDGYASASMVDISYLGFGPGEPGWSERLSLLDAPYWPFDGMNEQGLAVGMMAVPHARDAMDPQQVTIGSLDVLRLILDNAGSVDEAIALLQEYNVDFGGGPPLHYLIADAAGHSAVVEFIGGEMQVLPNEEAWQVATNFVISGHGPESAKAQCPRYAHAYETLEGAGGAVSRSEAMDLLQDVSQPITMWSVVYDLTSGGISVAMGREYDGVQEFRLQMGEGRPVPRP